MISWQVTLSDGKKFTFITDQCQTVEEVKAAIFEKMCKTIKDARKL